MQITNMHCSGQTVSLAAGDYHATGDAANLLI